MKTMIMALVFVFSFMLTACGQTDNQRSSRIENNKAEKKMDLSKLTNETVKNAVEALQSNIRTAWYTYFTDDATFTDDGRTLDFKTFFDNAFEKKEKFLDIDKVENEGKDIYGNFYAGQWGTFRVYFKFHQDATGKFNGLDIGQKTK